MTFLDKYKLDHDKVGELVDIYEINCPCYYGYEKCNGCFDRSCFDCWHREMPKTEETNEETNKLTEETNEETNKLTEIQKEMLKLCNDFEGVCECCLAYKTCSKLEKNFERATDEEILPILKEFKKETTKMNKLEKHSEITNELNKLYESKNKDYGDSFGKSFEDFGLTMAAIRIGDKYNRFKNLIKHNPEVKNESVEDTLMDLANYAIMTLIELRKD